MAADVKGRAKSHRLPLVSCIILETLEALIYLCVWPIATDAGLGGLTKLGKLIMRAFQYQTYMTVIDCCSSPIDTTAFGFSTDINFFLNKTIDYLLSVPPNT